MVTSRSLARLGALYKNIIYFEKLIYLTSYNHYYLSLVIYEYINISKYIMTDNSGQRKYQNILLFKIKVLHPSCG
jgi:hypothetical protein